MSSSPPFPDHAEGGLRAREQDLAGLLAAARAILRQDTFAGVARTIFQHCRRLLGAEGGYISLSTPDGRANELVFLEAGGRPCTVDPGLPMPIRGLRREAYAHRRAVYDNHFSRSGHRHFLPPGHVELDNVLFAPLNLGGRTIGLLGLANKPGGFTPEDCRLAEAFAELAAIALVKARQEEELRHHQEMLELMADSLPAFLAYVDAGQCYRLVNRSLCRYLGRPAADILGRPVREVLGDEWHQQVEPQMLRALAGEDVDFQVSRPEAHGLVRHFQVRYRPHRGENGAVHGFFVLAEDVTALKQAEHLLKERVAARTAELEAAVASLEREMEQRRQADLRLQEAATRYRTLFQAAASFVMTLCPTGRILEFNEEAERLSGWRREEVLTHSAVPLLVPPRLHEVAGELLARVTAGEVLREVEMPILRKDGGERLFLWNANLMRDPAGQPAEIIVVGQDISALRRAQTAVETERRRLFELLDHLPAYIFLQNPEHRVVFANRYFREHFGDPRGRTCHQILWGRERPCADCPTTRVFETGTPHVWEWTGTDGRTYQIYDYPFADVDGAPLVLEMGIDITARKQAEEEVREQARILEAFFEHTLTPLVFLDRDFKLLRVNEAYARACGRPLDALVGHNLFELHPHPENEAIFREVVRSKTPYVAAARPFVFPHRPELGVTYWDWILAPILDETGEVDFLVFSLHDVTKEVQARESQRRLTAILEATPDFVGISDTSGKVLYINEAGRRLLGVAPEEEVEGLTISACHPRWARERILQEGLPAARERGVWQGETALLTREGREIPLSQVILVHRDAEGREQFFSTIARDITPLREAEQQLRLLTSRILHAQEEERRRVARELHDEVGQSLLVLKMQMQALGRKLTGAEVQADCRRILSSLDLLVENVRRLSRDLSPAVLEDLGLSAALRHLVQEFQAHHEDLRLESRLEPVDDLLSPEAQLHLYRVFQEALTNIHKHARATRVWLHLSREGAELVGEVRDDGAGCPTSPEAPAAARGLGLATMAERLHLLRGELRLESAPGRGTRLRFRLPLPAGEART